MSIEEGTIAVSVSFFGIIVILFLAFFTVKALSSIFGHLNAGRGWVAVCAILALFAIGMAFFGMVTVRSHRVITGEEIAVANAPLVVHRDVHVIDSSIPSLAGDAQHLKVASVTEPSDAAQHGPASPSIEEMWKQLTAPRINLDDSAVNESVEAVEESAGPSSPQELHAAAKVILSASVPGADPFTQGWLVSAAKSILAREAPRAPEAPAAPVAEVEQVTVNYSQETQQTPAGIVQDDFDPLAKTQTIAAPKPDWLVTPPKQVGNVRRMVVASGPFSTLEECQLDLDRRMHDVVRNRMIDISQSSMTRRTGTARLDDMGLGGDYIRRELCTDEFVDTVDSSVGEMKQVYALLEFNEAQDAMLVDRARSYSRQEGLQDVSLIGGGLLASVATLFGLLKVDTWTRGYYTKRLFLGVPAAIITVLALCLIG